MQPGIKKDLWTTSYYGHSVLCASAGEGQKMPAGLQHTPALSPYLGTRYVVVPAIAHEGLAVGWIRHYGVDRVLLHTPHYLQAMTHMD